MFARAYYLGHESVTAINGVVACDNVICSNIGRDILMAGGTHHTHIFFTSFIFCF